jgi:translocation and assembly module TamB
MRLLRWGLVTAILFSAAIGALVFALHSDWFRNKVRERIVSETERATGGRVEIGEFRYEWRSLRAEVSPFVLHGTEPSGAPPLFRADRIQIGLRVVSVFEKNVDIHDIAIDQPQFHVTVDNDGKSNVPLPKIQRQSRGILQQLLDLKVSHLALRNGYADYNEARVPLNLNGTDVAADIRYEAGRPHYEGTLTARELRGQAPGFAGPLTANFKTTLSLSRDRLQLKSLQLERGGSHLNLSGDITNWTAPKGDFTVQSELLTRDLETAFHLPATGNLTYSGRGWFSTFPFSYGLRGDVKGQIQDVLVASDIEVDPRRLTMPHAHLKLLGGAFNGTINLADWSNLSVQGDAQSFPVQELVRAAAQKLDGLGGTASGPVKASAMLTSRGLRDLRLEANVTMAPGPTGLQLSGPLNVQYDQQAGKVVLGSSGLTLGNTHLEVAGTVGESVEWHVESRNLGDVLAALNVAGRQVKMPALELVGGTARFDGTVTGPISASHVAGKIQLTNFRYQEQKFDRFSAVLDASSSQLTLQSFSLDQGSLHAQGASASISLVDWQPVDSSAVAATVTATGIPLHQVVTGLASAAFTLKGTLGDPAGSGSIQANNLVAFDEQILHASAQATYAGRTLTISNGQLVGAGGGKILFTGNYQHQAHDLETGDIHFVVNGAGIGLASLHHVQDLYEGLRGQTAGKAAGTAKLTKGVLDLVSLEAEGSIRDILIDNHPFGTVALQANTHEGVLQVEGHADVRGTQLTGIGQWQLTGDYPGTAQIEIPHLTAATLHDISPGEHSREKLPFDGFVQGTIRIEGPLKKPDSLRARAIFDKVQINADPTAKPLAGALAKDLVIENSKPVLLRANTKSIEIESAEFAAKDTTLRATGRFALDSKTAWDLKLSGNVNLAILQLFNPDLLGSGSSVISVGIRGTFDQPDVDGRLELRNASLFLKDVPNGIDNANGVILFDRNRANIQSLSATTGGGKVIFQPGSFLGFRGTTVTYRLQAEAQDVRYRSPDGLSITVGAALSLVGTSESSVLSGTVTILKAGLSARTDIGSLLEATARPISTPTNPGEYLRGLQFDVRLVTAQSLQLETSLTRDVQAEANLRIRGNFFKPVVLGNLTVNSGEIDFFGNKYSITRGEVNFLNPTKIDPILDMDLETKVRGIVVDIRFSGPLNKLNFSYRSDPPFQPNQIIALLAVGRVPTATGGLASSQTGATSGFLATSSNELVNQAIAPSNGRLERFFGVSHIKIDPQFTDVTAIPQARLTLEQQISKEVTLTYITNLTRAQEQLIRVEWDLSRQWAVVALRDESGAFGIDVQYKKRFK